MNEFYFKRKYKRTLLIDAIKKKSTNRCYLKTPIFKSANTTDPSNFFGQEFCDIYICAESLNV